jgi:hypothetical protein
MKTGERHWQVAGRRREQLPDEAFLLGARQYGEH